MVDGPIAPASRFIAEVIDLPATAVYAFASDPVNLPAWAAGLASGIAHLDGQWVADSPLGRVIVTMSPPNEFGVLDHTVRFPDGRLFLNPLRVLPLGDAAEIVFTLRVAPGMTPAEVDSDAAAIAADLGTLKRLLEASAW